MPSNSESASSTSATQPSESRTGVVASDRERVAERGDSPKIAPTLKLSRVGLILSLAAMVGAGLGVYALFPDSVGGPPLPVEVRLDRQPVDTANGSGAVVTEVVVVTNLTDHEIPKLSVDINGQYLLFRDSPLAQKELLVLPLRVFTDKRSSQRFNPSKYPVEDVTVTGQLPTGARGVTQFVFEDNLLVETK